MLTGICSFYLSPVGKSYTARIAPNHLNIFLNLATLYSRDSSRLEEAAAVSFSLPTIIYTPALIPKCCKARPTILRCKRHGIHIIFKINVC